MKKIKYIVIAILLILIGLEGFKAIKYNNENKELRSVQQEYIKITKEISELEMMKNDLKLMNSKNSSIQIKIDETNEIINSLDEEINNYKNKIATLNHKLSK